MFKIAICGKANTGKNTVSKLLYNEIFDTASPTKLPDGSGVKYIAFADPIKEMIRLMFPQLPKKYLFGSSQYRSEVIPGALKNGKPLTIRDALIDLGTGVGRSYKENIWLDAFDHSFNKINQNVVGVCIVTDVRFRNEFNHLKQLGFYQIRLLRDAHLKINHASETNQDSIKDDEFDFVINNNGTLDDLKISVSSIVSQLKH
jgi:hypothetical protein